MMLRSRGLLRPRVLIPVVGLITGLAAALRWPPDRGR
jgi:hypothetical protein